MRCTTSWAKAACALVLQFSSPASLASFSTDVAPHEDGGRLGVCVEEHASPIILESNTTVESNNRILESPGESLRSPLLQRAEPM